MYGPERPTIDADGDGGRCRNHERNRHHRRDRKHGDDERILAYVERLDDEEIDEETENMSEKTKEIAEETVDG